MYDYGNARIAALRGRCLQPADFRRLAELDSPGAMLEFLDRFDDWRPVLRETAPLFGDPQAAIEASIERHRSARSASLVGWYEGSDRRLVEALVMPLDLERVIAITRRQRGGASASSIGGSIAGGALLDVAALGVLARAPTPAGLAAALVRAGLVSAEASREIAAAGDAGRGGRALEERLLVAFDDARAERAKGRGRDAGLVRAVLAEERAARATVARELQDAGPASAWLVERFLTLARLDRLARAGPRDPLGIGAVAGYVAALEAQAVRLRAGLARIVSGWSPEALRPFMPAAGV